MLEKGATQCQQNAYAEFTKVFDNLAKGHMNEFKMYCLSGAAGCGKTWLVSILVKYAVEKRLKCYLSTPTHKAVQVLREMLQEVNLLQHNSIDTGTIHRFLNLKLEYNFEDDSNMNPEVPKLIKNIHVPLDGLPRCDILFVDEASMVDINLYNMIESEIGDRFRIVIFIGDYFQLPPVGSSISPVFTNSEKNKVVQLVETVRQKSDSFIINRAAWLKYYIQTQIFPDNILDLFITHGEMKIFQNNIENESLKFMETYFEIKDCSKIMGTYTNALVDSYNSYIRNKELDYPKEIITVGEKFIVQVPYENSVGDIIFTSNQEIEISKCKVTEPGVSKYKLYRITTTEDDSGSIVHEDSLEEYNKDLADLLQRAKAVSNVDKKNRGRAWGAYFGLLNRYVKVKSAYASTIHKLQGSTYDDAFLDLRTVEQFYPRMKDLMCRLLYVGITRPKRDLYILK